MLDDSQGLIFSARYPIFIPGMANHDHSFGIQPPSATG